MSMNRRHFLAASASLPLLSAKQGTYKVGITTNTRGGWESDVWLSFREAREVGYRWVESFWSYFTAFDGKPAELKAKVEAPGGNVEKQGCADASLYQRLQQAGLTQVQMFPQWAAFDSSDPNVLQFMQDVLLAKLSQEEAQEWQTARAQAEAEGTFFMAWPHHWAVGTKP